MKNNFKKIFAIGFLVSSVSFIIIQINTNILNFEAFNFMNVWARLGISFIILLVLNIIVFYFCFYKENSKGKKFKKELDDENQKIKITKNNNRETKAKIIDVELNEILKNHKKFDTKYKEKYVTWKGQFYGVVHSDAANENYNILSEYPDKKVIFWENGYALFDRIPSILNGLESAEIMIKGKIVEFHEESCLIALDNCKLLEVNRKSYIEYE